MLRSFLLASAWIAISFGYHDDRRYELKAFMGSESRFQKPPSCADYFKHSNFNTQATVPDHFPTHYEYNRPDFSGISFEEFYSRPCSNQAHNEIPFTYYDDFEKKMRLSFRNSHEILNCYEWYDYSYFRQFVKRNCDNSVVRSHLRSVKKRYCTEKDFRKRADRLSFNLFEEADNLLAEIESSNQFIEIEDFYHEYKYFSYVQSPHADRYKKRCEALTRQYQEVARKTKLHPLTEKILDENSKRLSNFKKFKGNAFQAQLYDEFIEILDRTSKLNGNTRSYISDIVSLVDIGQSLNQQGYLVKAALIADCCWSFIAACAQGIALGASDLLHFIIHPIDSTIESVTSLNSTAYHLGRLFYQISEASSLASLQHIELQYEGNYEALSNKSGIGLVLGNEANQKVRSLCSNCSSISRSFYEQCKDLSWCDKTKYFFAIGTEAFLTKRCSKVLHSIANKAALKTAQLLKDAHTMTVEAAIANPNAAIIRVVGQAASIAHDLAAGKQFRPVSIDELRNIYATYSTLKALQPKKAVEFQRAVTVYKDVEVSEKESVRGCFDPIPPPERKPGCGDIQQPKIDDYILVHPIPPVKEPVEEGCFKPIPIEIKPGCGGIKPIQEPTLFFTQDAEQEAQTQKPDQLAVPTTESAGEQDVEKPKVKTPEDIIKDTTPGRETMGSTKQFEKPGDYNTALEDFESLGLSGVKDIKNGNGKLGILPDGKRVNIRNDSTDLRPTLEIYNPITKKSIKIRYGDK